MESKIISKQTELRTAWYSTDCFEGTDCSFLSGKINFCYLFTVYSSVLLKQPNCTLHQELYASTQGEKVQMSLYSELLINALCDSGCADWLDYHFQKKIMSYFPLRRTQ